jgi:hypothetical protein
MRAFSAFLLGSLTFVAVVLLVLLAEVPLIHRFARVIEQCTPNNQVCDGGQMVSVAVGTVVAIAIASVVGAAVRRRVLRGGLRSSAG